MNRPDIDETTIRQELHDIALQNQQLAAAGEYAAAIMHEINSPLEAVTNLNYLIQQEADDPDRVMEYSTLIDEQLALIGNLSRQTLSFYRSRETREAIAISTLAEAAL